MMHHPFIHDLTNKTMDELGESINNLNKQLQFMYRMGKSDMVSQISLAINTYKAEYTKRQQELWNKKNNHNMDNKIDIS